MVAIRLYSLYRSYGYTKMSSAKRALQMIRGSTKTQILKNPLNRMGE